MKSNHDPLFRSMLAKSFCLCMVYLPCHNVVADAVPQYNQVKVHVTQGLGLIRFGNTKEQVENTIGTPTGSFRLNGADVYIYGKKVILFFRNDSLYKYVLTGSALHHEIVKYEETSWPFAHPTDFTLYPMNMILGAVYDNVKERLGIENDPQPPRYKIDIKEEDVLVSMRFAPFRQGVAEDKYHLYEVMVEKVEGSGGER